MSSSTLARHSTRFAALPSSIESWQAGVIRRQLLPVIAVAGSRGKSTVVRLLDAIFSNAGLRSATWTSSGVEIRGRRQSGELAPWSRALSRLAEGTLDVAIQELDWSTVHAVGLPARIYPVVGVTNICVNSDLCLLQEETRRATSAFASVVNAVDPDGTLVLNGEDYAVSGSEAAHHGRTALVAQSKETPLLRTHLSAGGFGAWCEGDDLRAGSPSDFRSLGPVADLQFALRGRATFEVHNALTAGAIALHCGVPAATVASVLPQFSVPPLLLPGSFNVIEARGFTAVVDRATPSWFLRSVLRALNHHKFGRTITVLGRLDRLPETDLTEIGRRLGRSSDVLVLHSQQPDTHQASLLRQGAALTDIPPVVIHVPTERQAVNRALKLLNAGDTGLFLADDPASVIRALQRAGNAAEGSFSAGRT